MKSKILYFFIILMIMAFAAYLLRVAFVGDPLEEVAQVRDLRLTQEGLEVTANWSELDCKSYDVVYTINGRLTTVSGIRDNTYTIRGVYPGDRCKVTVRAWLNNGLPSFSESAVLKADKVKQAIQLNDTTYYGFTGNDFRLRASANGDLHYRSSDKNVAEVDSSGNVKFKESGEAEILISAKGNGLFSDAERTVEVVVYPSVLDKIQIRAVKNISPSRAIIRWKPDEYAATYKVLRKNPATQEFEELLETPAEVTYLEVTRDDYDYEVKGVAEVNGKKVDGRVSDVAEVRGTTEEAPTYSSFKVIKKLGKSDLNLVADIQGAGETGLPESMSIIGDQCVISYVNPESTLGNLIEYNKNDGKMGAVTKANGIGHANGSAYNPNTNRLYVLSTKNGEKTKKCYVFDAKTKKLIKKMDMPVVTSAIAYDISTDKFYLAKAETIYVCDSHFRVEKTLTKTAPYLYTQDIGAYNNTILVCTWPGKNKSYIDIYKASDGAYLGSYDVSIGEIESCAVDDGYLLILMNTIGNRDDKIYRTKERIAIP